MKTLRPLYVLLSLAFLTSCAAGGNRGFPVWTYGDECQYLSVMPDAPPCLMYGEVFGGFRYDYEFQACRESVNNYMSALNNWYDCVIEELTQNYNSYADQAKQRLVCMESQLNDETSKPIEIDCPIVDVRIDENYYLDRHESTPICLQKKILIPRYSFELERCTNEVNDYLINMREQIRDPIELRHKVEDAADRAIRKFNCIAKREKFCF